MLKTEQTPKQTPEKKDYKHISEAYKDGLDHLKGRRNGTIRSIKTPWKDFNDAGIDGIEWNTILVIGGRPASGKTLVVNQLTRDAFDLNPNEEFCVLDCQWEMLARTMAIREFSSHMKKSVKELSSAGGYILTDEDIATMELYAKTRSKYPIYIIEKPRTIDQFERGVEKFIDVDMKGKKTIVTVDHSILFRKSASEQDKFETLYNLGETLTRMKRKLPVIFIILSQLNREVEKAPRLESGSASNYLLDSDIFGGDALLMHTDMLCLINRPKKYNLKEYGPERFICGNNDLAFHFNKVRNGDPRLVFFQAQFEHMKVIDYPWNPNTGACTPDMARKSKGVIPIMPGLISTKNLI